MLLAVALLAAGCSPGGTGAPTAHGLAQTSWTVASIAGAATLPEARPTMTFAQDGTMSGNGGCNQYSGPFRVDGDKISIGPVAATLMGCEGQRGAQESTFLAALQGATNWRHAENGDLVLTGAGDIVAGPGVAEGSLDAPVTGESPTAELAASAWALQEMGGTADFAHLVPTLVFGTDGTVSGFAGCNQFNASYTATAGDLTLGPIVTTKMACPRPGSVVETTYLEALAGVTSWSIDDAGRLILGGNVPLTFAPG
jgi:heat shock protein HslJ